MVTSNNPYIRFMKRNGGKGYSSVELRAAYKKNPASTLRKKSVSRKATKRVSRKRSRKVARKRSRKASRKVARKASRKGSRKASRKASRKGSRKASKKSSARGLEALTLIQLRTKAKERGFKGYSRLNKPDLIDRLRSGKKVAEPAFLWNSPKLKAPGKRTPIPLSVKSPQIRTPGWEY